MNSRAAAIAVVLLPAIVASLGFHLALGHRRDYLGHFAAGYGGALALIAIALAMIPPVRYPKLAAWVVVPCTLLAIAAGTVTEATVFNIAKFDEVDYCNQNLGAVIAGLVGLHFVRPAKPPDADFRWALLTGVSFVLIGGYFALT
ncbi:MAG: hypothetical protein ABGY75_20310 [Gemmataceae bacterium]